MAEIYSKKTVLFLFLFVFFLQAAYLPQISLRQKIGQMVMVGFNGLALGDSIVADLSQRNLGGVILMGANIQSSSQLSQLTSQLKQKGTSPLFISTDEEGGNVARLGKSNGYESTYTAYQLGTIFNSVDSTRMTAAKIAGWLSKAGINIDFAPVADVNVNPNSPAIGRYQRSFSSSPTDVAKYAGIFVEELNKKNVVSVLKHFPGHGSAMSDSHLGFTDITNTWADSELVPYKILIGSGFSQMVMAGHLFNSNLDSLYPASISNKIVTGLLRNKLGFAGVVITDDMTMGAISNNYDFDEAIELAINAGVDILLYVTNLNNSGSIPRQVIDIVEQKVKAGKITEARIDESYNRIMTLKQKLLTLSAVNDKSKKGEPVAGFSLQNYPNPFNPNTNIVVKIRKTSFVSIKIYNVTGQVVAQLANGQMAAGEYKINFDGKNLSSGIYLVRMETPEFAISKKIALIK
jgi:beta-N-acetylhexosaminidase